MAESTRKKPYGRVAILGVISFISYYLLVTNQSVVTEYFIKGSYYAALPIFTALLFSFIHGAFCSGVLSIMGISAKGSSH